MVKRRSSKETAKTNRHSARKRTSSTLAAEPIGAGTLSLPSIPILWNAQDSLAVQMLATAKLGDLPVDRFADLFGKETPDAQNRVAALRQALIGVYQAAANQRQRAKASRAQIDSAKAALGSLKGAIKP